MTTLVLLMIAYAVTLLVPLIPAILVFKLFPRDRATAEGTLQGIKFKASGAFAAYVITVAMGFWLSSDFKAVIASTLSPTWTVTGTIEIRNGQGDPVNDPREMDRLRRKIDFQRDPRPLETIDPNAFVLTICGPLGQFPRGWLMLDGYRPGDVHLNVASEIEVDREHYRINVRKPVVLNPSLPDQIPTGGKIIQ